MASLHADKQPNSCVDEAMLRRRQSTGFGHRSFWWHLCEFPLLYLGLYTRAKKALLYLYGRVKYWLVAFRQLGHWVKSLSMKASSQVSSWKSGGRLENRPLIPDAMVADLKSKMSPEITSSHNIGLLSSLSREEREYFARASQTVVLYLGEEVDAVMKAEEDAVMRAAPSGHPLTALNGVNIGCGQRTVSPLLLQIDIMREAVLDPESGAHGQLNASAFLADPNDLPFKEASIDYMVSLHTLEHIEDPIETVNHWLNVIKPGGGIGIVVPDWRYTWDARNDHAPYSHKWNPTPGLIEQLYSKYWSDRAMLEQLCSYEFALSFDFVLRKQGSFVPFTPPHLATIKSGAERYKQGIFLHGE